MQCENRGGMDVNLNKIIKRITPSDEEHKTELKLVERLHELIEEYDVEPILVGSLAKETDLAGNKDIDFFIQFQSDVSREELERQGLKIGKEVFKKLGAEYEIDYAEHPYVKGKYLEHTIEIVPCYKDNKKMSSVDRTPYHTKYVKGKTTGNDLKDQIRLLKQFMTATGVYGAEAKIEGFSGYLAELLMIHYGSFTKVLEAAKDWKIPEVIDTEKQWENPNSLTKFFTNANLVVIDPVDKTRNVAAAVSTECLSKFIVTSNQYLQNPSEEHFFPKEKQMRSKEELIEAMYARGTKFTAIVFEHDKINANTLYAQLRKTTKQIVKDLEMQEFKIFKTAFWTNEKDKSIILLELEVWELPELTHHQGPPTSQDPKNQERFTQKYQKDKPYIKDGRWVVDTKRKHTNHHTALQEIINGKEGFGKNIKETRKIIVENEKILEFESKKWRDYFNRIII